MKTLKAFALSRRFPRNGSTVTMSDKWARKILLQLSRLSASSLSFQRCFQVSSTRVVSRNVAVFLFIGAALGPWGLGLFNMTLDSPALRVVATLSLTLVLFTDAVTLDISDVKRNAGLAFRMLGPGTILCAALTALAAWWLLESTTRFGRHSRRCTRFNRSRSASRTAAQTRSLTRNSSCATT